MSKFILSDFIFEDSVAYVKGYHDKVPTEISTFGLTSNKGNFDKRLKNYLCDLSILYALGEVYGIGDSVVVDIPVSRYIAENGERYYKRLFSWINKLSSYTCPNIIFSNIRERDSVFPEYSPDKNSAVIGWSGGKESLMSYEVLKEMGFTINKITIDKPGDRESISEYTLEPYSSYGTTNQEIILPNLYQSYICIPLLFSFMMKALETNSGTFVMGGEYGTSITKIDENGDEIFDLAGDEGIESFNFLKNYMLEEYSKDIDVVSPVSGIPEVGIIRFLIEHKGYKLSDLRSCWEHTFYKRNCEYCTKCTRIKVYAQYLIGKGVLTLKDYYDAYKTLDYPDIVTPELLSYSIYTYEIIRDIKNNSPFIDWSKVYVDAPREMEALGKMRPTIEKYFSRYDYRNLKLPFFVNQYDSEYIRNEIARYLGIDYRKIISGSSPKHCIIIFFPYENYFFTEGMFNLSCYFNPIELYSDSKPVGLLHIGEKHFIFAEHNENTFKTDSEMIKIVLNKDAILEMLDSIPSIEYTFEEYKD